MFVHAIDPVLVRIFGLEIRYYGVVYAASFLVAYYALRHFSRKGFLQLSEELVDRLVVWLMVGVVGGARVFEILFFSPGYYFNNPLEMLMIWHGGLSFHGGLVGAILALFLFSRKYGVDWLRLADALTMPAALMLGFGRIANFINGELPGRLTGAPWGVQFPGYDGVRHPSQLYEAAKNFVIFGILFFQRSKLEMRGFLTGTFLLSYGILRFLVEFVREPETSFLGVTTGQWFSFVMILCGWVLLRSVARKK